MRTVSLGAVFVAAVMLSGCAQDNAPPPLASPGPIAFTHHGRQGGHGPVLYTASYANAAIAASGAAWGSQVGRCVGTDLGGQICSFAWDGNEDPTQSGPVVRALDVSCGMQGRVYEGANAPGATALPSGGFWTDQDSVHVVWQAPDAFADAQAGADLSNICTVVLKPYSRTGVDPLRVKDLALDIADAVEEEALTWTP